MITGLAHACFNVADLQGSIDFYCNKLGLTPAFPFINAEGVHFGQYIYVGGRAFIELFQRPLAEKAEQQSYSHICLEVDDIAATVAAIRANGVEVTDPKLGGDGTHQAWLADPDGNRIELFEYTAQSRQGPFLK
jgi:catechol 2,3-dioxygenase-like lactoylglutathione lyase family enzyme